MASYIFSKLTSLSKPITPNKPRIEIEEENVSEKTPIVNVDDGDDDVEEVGDDDVEEVGDDDVEEVVDECFDDFVTNKIQKMMI